MTYYNLTRDRSFQAVSRVFAAAGNLLLNAPEAVRVWRERRFLRGELRRLLRVGPYIIDDMGLDLDEVRKEADKPFWRA